MDKNTTNLIKFACCILIFFHHYFILEVFACTWGRIACSVFFFLSSYGICKSQEKNNYKLLTFCQKRLSRILIPYVLVNLLAIIGVSFMQKGVLAIPLYQLVGHGIKYINDFIFTDFLFYVFGLCKIDGAMWFIDVLLLSYIFIWFVTKINNKVCRDVLVIICPICLLVLDRICKTHICLWPTDTIGIISGILLFDNEKRVLSVIKSKHHLFQILCFIIFCASVFLYMFLKDNSAIEWKYLEMIMLLYSFSSICIAMSIPVAYRCPYTKICTALGGVSFFVYLLHIKVVDVINFYSYEPLLWYSLISLAILSALLFQIDNKIQKAIWRT